ncbi:MAG: DUF4856 domain-containing protein [Myxococcales bacterium]|nr:DUF4856 domain-containing protein [Myxococcales bacterium]
MKHLVVIPLAFVVALCVGCGSDDDNKDTGGGSAVDAAVAADGGSSATDSGSAAADSGSTASDSGSAATDSGAGKPDSGGHGGAPKAPTTYKFTSVSEKGPGCYSGPPTHKCDCAVAEADCKGTWTDTCPCGPSSVSHGGQTARHVLIAEMKTYLTDLTAEIKKDPDTYGKGGVVKDGINFFFLFDASVAGDQPFKLSTTPETMQKTWNDLSAPNLKGKIAGNDAKGQHKEWKTEDTLQGWKLWAAGDLKTPEGLYNKWVGMIDDLAVSHAKGEAPKDPAGKDITKVFVNSAGHDLQQLLQKYLLGAIAFSQGADDYLDDDTDGKGLKCDNTKPYTKGDKTYPYTALEHAWDEGKGYFGSSDDYNDYTDDELAGKSDTKKNYFDTDGDGKIDLKTEYNFGHCLNAAKRDRGSQADSKTDYSKAIFDAFLQGRFIISSAKGALSADAAKDLAAQRDIIVSNWEKAIAATVVHYINDVLADMATIGTDTYSFYDHAKHWGELKGFGLSFQFSRFSPMKDDFVKFHDLVGDAPVLGTASADDQAAYIKALKDARALLGKAYGFADKNVENW